MDLQTIISLVQVGKSCIEYLKQYNVPQELEDRISELEKEKKPKEIIALLEEFAKNGNTAITQTNYGQGAMNFAGGSHTINLTSEPSSDKRENPDVKLFKDISDDFTDEFVELIRIYDFTDSFERKHIGTLLKFYKYNNPKYSFINETLEAKWSILFASLKEFSGYIELETFDLDNGRRGIEQKLEISNQKQRDKTIKKLNSLASDVCRKYDDFIVTGKRVLNV
jgi:hypothetical protein